MKEFDRNYWWLGGDDPDFTDTISDLTPEEAGERLLPHPAARLFPRMSKEEGSRLGNSICMGGLREPILTDKHGRVIDGMNRKTILSGWGNTPEQIKAMETADGQPAVQEFKGTDAEILRFVLDRNLTRRHLSDAQKKEVNKNVKALFGTRERGGNAGVTATNGASAPLPTPPPSQSDRAAMFGKDRHTIKRWDADDRAEAKGETPPSKRKRKDKGQTKAKPAPAPETPTQAPQPAQAPTAQAASPAPEPVPDTPAPAAQGARAVLAACPNAKFEDLLEAAATVAEVHKLFGDDQEFFRQMEHFNPDLTDDDLHSIILCDLKWLRLRAHYRKMEMQGPPQNEKGGSPE